MEKFSRRGAALQVVRRDGLNRPVLPGFAFSVSDGLGAGNCLDHSGRRQYVRSSLADVLDGIRIHEAFAIYSQTSGREKGKFLRTIAAKIEGAVDGLVERAEQESALPKPRLQGETARTCGQLRLFAEVVEEGSWVMARIDRADPGRKPAPRPDIRSMLHALGPVVVFGASNFPLAFSVAGGDTASALAAGNPVIVKGHPAHPGTSELVGQLLRESARECGLPEGVFSLLLDSGAGVGVSLVKHPLVKAVGFTGSHSAGRALMISRTSQGASGPGSRVS